MLRLQYNYFIPLISFLGLIFGLILKKIAKEEVVDGRTYLDLFEKIVLVLIIIVLFPNLSLSFNAIMYLVVGVLFGYIIGKYLTVYFYLGLSLVLSFLFSKNFFFLSNVLVFLFGLPRGSLIKFKAVYKNLLFFIIPFVGLLFLEVLGGDFFNILSGVCIGGFFKEFVKRKFISF